MDVTEVKRSTQYGIGINPSVLLIHPSVVLKMRIITIHISKHHITELNFANT